MNPDVEYQQGKNIADVSKESGVQHLIWSSLMNVTKRESGPFMFKALKSQTLTKENHY